MLEQITLNDEWNLQPANVQKFARIVSQNFDTLATFIQQTQHTLLELKITSDKINHLDTQAQEAYSFAQKIEFQTTQQIGYLTLQLEKCQEQISQNDTAYTLRMEEIQTSADQNYQLQQNLSKASKQELEAVLVERQREIDSIKETLTTSQENAKNIAEMFQTQISQFYTQQTIYSQDFVKVQKKMYENSEKIQGMYDKMDEKMLDFEQNFFVGLTQRVMDCESKMQKNDFEKGEISFKINENKKEISALQEVQKGACEQQKLHESAIQVLQEQVVLQEEKQLNQFDEHENLIKKVNLLRSDLVDQIGLEIESRETEIAEIVQKTNSLIEEMGELEDDLTRKINFCNDFVVNSGMQKEYNLARRQEYENNLDSVFEEGCLEVGQIKLVKAITVRMREIENKLMQVIARTGGIE